MGKSETTAAKKDPVLESGCLISAAVAIGFFVYLGVDRPETWSVSKWYIGAAVALVVFTGVSGRRTPFSRAAAQFETAERERLRAALGQRIDSLMRLSPRECEMAVARLFEAEGWAVTVTPQSADGGKDLVLSRDGRKVLVEVKQYDSRTKVGRPAIMKLHSAVVHERASGGIFVTTSSYSEPAREFAELNEIVLVDGPALAARLEKAFGEAVIEIRGMCKKCGTISRIADVRSREQSCECGGVVANPLPARSVPAPSLCPDCQVPMAQLRDKKMRMYTLECPRCGRGPMSWEAKQAPTRGLR